MKDKSLPIPVVATVITVIVLVVGFFLYKGVTGGTVGDGKTGNVQASPPMPDAAKQQMRQNAQGTRSTASGGPRP
jgi:hypothetical protein